MIIIYMNFSLMLMLFSFLSMLMLLKFLILKLKIFIEFKLMEINSMNFSLMIYFDYKTFMFMMTVMLISSMIIIYSIEYMSMDKFNLQFMYILFLFILSMLFMIVGQNLLMILLGWDGLGLISYCLVIYYNNWNSYNAGMLTILTNRLGDVGLLISIGMFSMVGDWNYMVIMLKDNILLMFFILLASITKSAQIPFSSWLPMAMAAPTPISALVHSSTLVTAGVYLLIRFNEILMEKLIIYLMLYLSMLTMFFSGFIAVFENDLKKIIALSTLSQLGLMMMSLFIGMKLYGFFHLVIHAMFKSLLFMCAGLFLHSMMNNQDIRFLGGMSKNYLLTLMMFNCSNLALCGFPFMSGFYSKDFILEMSIYKNLNFMILVIFYMSIMFTVIYTFRLIYFMINSFMMYFNNLMCYDNKLMNFSMLFMFLNSIIMGLMFNWLIFSSISIIIIWKGFKMLLNLMILISMLLGLFLNKFNNNYKFLLKFKILFKFFKNMMMMNYFSNMIIKNILFLGKFMFLNLDKGWIELSGKNLFKYIYLNLMSIEKVSLNLIIKLLLIYLMMMFIMILF